jgi:hypothetical protein
MSFSRLNRRVHYWLTPLVLGPILVIVATGLLLHARKDIAWVQPAEQKGTGYEPLLNFNDILLACRALPEAEVQTWKDIARVDVRPAKGILKVTCKNNHEVQLDLASGQVLSVAYRRSDIINAIHEGAFFGSIVKWYLFLPAALALGILSITGFWMFLQPFKAKARRQARAKSIVANSSES